MTHTMQFNAIITNILPWPALIFVNKREKIFKLKSRYSREIKVAILDHWKPTKVRFN